MTYLDWFKTIAFALNDDEPEHEFARYSLDKLLAAYNAALCVVAKYRPDLFTELRNVQLQPGKYQDVRGCCTNVLDVLEQVDNQGNILKTLSGGKHKNSTVPRVWKKPSCRNLSDEYRVNSYGIDINMNGRFTVEPPVPCGENAYVLVKCVREPCRINLLQMPLVMDTDCIYNVAAWHYVVGSMLSGDRFDNAGAGDKAFHFRMFYELLQIVEVQEDRYEQDDVRKRNAMQ